ncbi:hypothetical protein GobsT_57430 [Gemmata obscuriglobus]|nr:hypothetical protein GobsT_57430 [Gemmata obscuriglobus]VTS10258.1 Uncharacterized protein OS=Pirellula staleyi (strain ATCC 27377 / DSM 6068 / ICPB 4128) GN=Psta_2333 PE=4 SV=1 [Gemmata obscuriglobus UQM 2246]
MLTAVFSLAFVLTTGSATPVPKEADCPAAYYPTKIGTKWSYDCRGVRPRNSGEMVVRNVERKGNDTVVTTEFEDGGQWRVGEKMLVSSRGLFVLERGGSTFDPPVCLLKLPHKPGAQWETVTKFGDSEIRFKHKALRPELVRVAAGRFEALPVVEHMQFVDSDAKLWPNTHWYAPGVGRVKQTNEGGLRYLMESFTPPER